MVVTGAVTDGGSVTALVASPVPPVEAGRALLALDGAHYAVALAWVLVAPLALLATGLVPRGPWPYVVVATAYLVTVVALAARVSRWLPDWSLALGTVGVVAVLTSVVVVVARRPG